MEIHEAADLISGAVPVTNSGQQWADLGCGSGTFTLALASLLHGGSIIHAIDKSHQSIKNAGQNLTKIIFRKADFASEELELHNLDGILMANSLHYVANKPKLVKRLKNYISGNGKLIIVEYDTDRSNTWVPYPLTFEQLRLLFLAEGFSSVEQTGERPSIYDRRIIACLIRR